MKNIGIAFIKPEEAYWVMNLENMEVNHTFTIFQIHLVLSLEDVIKGFKAGICPHSKVHITFDESK